jgi:hypothetical protein
MLSVKITFRRSALLEQLPQHRWGRPDLVLVGRMRFCWPYAPLLAGCTTAIGSSPSARTTTWRLRLVICLLGSQPQPGPPWRSVPWRLARADWVSSRGFLDAALRVMHQERFIGTGIAPFNHADGPTNPARRTQPDEPGPPDAGRRFISLHFRKW